MERLEMEAQTKEAIASATSGTRRKMDELVDWGKEKAAHLKDTKAANLLASTTDYVKANPGKTILVSLAVGFVIGSLVRRRGGE